MKATITLREGKSYTLGAHVITSNQALETTNPDLIAKAKRIGVLHVDVEQDTAPEPMPEATDDDAGDDIGEGSGESTPAPAKPKTGKPVGFKPGNKGGKFGPKPTAPKPALDKPEDE